MALRIANQMTWVDASAGTGKTKTLVDRVLSLLLEGVPLRKILCITFTKAAATEMKVRVLDQLQSWLLLDDINLMERVLALMEHPETLKKSAPQCREIFVQVVDHLDALRIQTIHSFCQEILNLFPLEAQIPPSFEMIDESESHLIFKEAFHQTLRDQTITEAFRLLLNFYQQGAIETMIQDILGDALLATELEATAFETPQVVLNITFQDAPPFALSPEIIDALMQTTKGDQTLIQGLITWHTSAKDLKAFQRYKTLYLTQKNEPRARLCSKKILDMHPQFQDILESQADWVTQKNGALQELQAHQVTQALCCVAQKVKKSFTTLKTQRGVLDYDDLIQNTKNLLAHTPDAEWIRFKLDGGVDHILVDEAQDTSPYQWQILISLMADFFSGNSATEVRRSVFIVGDPKQSIYSFQGANADYFRQLKRSMEDYVTASQNPWKTVKLEKSFRSNAAILNVVDHILSKQSVLLQEAVEEFHNVQHESARHQDGGIVELWPLITPDKDSAPSQDLDDDIPPLALTQVLAQKIADKIKEILVHKTMLPSQNRVATPGDILILVQRRNRFMYDLIKSLKAHNIPVNGPDRLKLCEQIYIQDLMAFGSFLILPEDDFNLACLLKSPLFNLTDQDLEALIFHKNESHSLWQALKNNAAYAPIYAYLKEYLNRVDYLSPFELYQHLMIQGQGRIKFRARFGSEADDGIDAFLKMTLDGSLHKHETLRQFLSRLITHQPEIKRDFSSAGSGAVRIMTAHGAKGLQAPIVFMPDTTRIPKELNVLLWDPTDQKVHWNAPSKSATNTIKSLKSSERDKMYTEYLRLLYVALTRPQDQLYIGGWQTKLNTQKSSWYDLIQETLRELNTTSCPVSKSLTYTAVQERHISFDAQKFETTVNDNIVDIPSWFSTPAKYERSAQETIAPSHDPTSTKSVQDAYAEQRAEGTLLHKLLEHPQQAPEIFKQHKVVDPQKKMDLLDLVQRTLENPEFKELLDLPCLKEMPIMGTIDGKLVKGQIDRVVIEEDCLTIIDYKSDQIYPKKPEDIPPKYVAQLKAYETLMRPLYPNKEIVCKILWIRHQKMDSITPEMIK